MSAIVGVVFFDGRPVEPGLLQNMTQPLRHRGPDGIAHWQSGHVGLGHCLRHTTPESQHEKLPLSTHDGSFCITADARLDNRDELLDALRLPTAPNVTSDSALILAAYRKWGGECASRLLGDFAFALWDASRQQLFCARDHMGVKPFYLYHDRHLFAFATEIKALLALPHVPRRLNEVRLADYILSEFDDASSTLYEGIERLPPAHALHVTRDALQPRRYWNLDASFQLPRRSSAEYAEQFGALFEQAVGCRLRSASDIGATLSGGLDSSSIAVMSAELLRADASTRLHTFSAVYEHASSSDERPFINAVLDYRGMRDRVEAHHVHPERWSPLHAWEESTEDEPLWNPQMMLHWSLFEAAQASGAHVLLDGHGGDDVVSNGLPYLRELAARGRWRTFFAESRMLAQRFDLDLGRLVWQTGFRPFVPPWARRVRGLLSRRTLMRRTPEPRVLEWDAPISAALAQRIALRDRLQQRAEHTEQPETQDASQLARSAHIAGLMQGHNAFAMEVNDRSAALLGVEMRYPFFDRRLVEFCVALPAGQKLQAGWPRSILRRGMKGLLPPVVQWRSDKGNLSGGFHHGFHKDMPVVRDVIFEGGEAIAPYMDVPALRGLHERYQDDNDDHSAFVLWRCVKIALWLRRCGFTSVS